MAEYRLTRGSAVVRAADGAEIPDDPRNTDRQAYAVWLDAGNAPDGVDLALLASAKTEAIETLYAGRLLHGFDYGGKRFELDEASQGKIGDLATASGFFALGVGGVTWDPIPFVAADNSVQVFATAADFIAFANAAKLATQALFARRYVLKTACRAAATAEALDAIDIEAGWPDL
ncbi:MAG: hypothetical protein NTV97_00995 [Alphaproteobacteria bacterium]|nr:hypothetical protein [Alphaproteobacteria bacterium]